MTTNHPEIDSERGFLLGYFGDDFTGSTDVMEVLAKVGLRTALFTHTPTAAEIRRLEGVDAVGITGNTRSLPTESMASTLRPALDSLRGLGAPIVHYKTCSTFDSSPAVGSIGRVVEIGAEVFESAPVPVVVGAPELGRYCVFGNLFARSGLDSEPYRLDRHPTMRQHPVTPMNESDLRLHLAEQTSREVALLDILKIAASQGEAVSHYRRLAKSRPGAILIDLLLEEQLETVGAVLCSQSLPRRSLFVVGSSGIEMALGAAWLRSGLAPGRASFAHSGRKAPLLVLSGSCSPVTRDQVKWVQARGFVAVAVETESLVRRDPDSDGEARVAAEIHDALSDGRSVVAHTALGPEDSRIAATRAHVADETRGTESSIKALVARRIGEALGRIGKRVLATTSLERVVVTGGDTSFHVARELAIDTLEMVAPMAPGSPLCRAAGVDSAADGIEFVFKGGQVGKTNLLERIIHGTP